MSETELLFTFLAFASIILMLAKKELGFHLLIVVVPFANLMPKGEFRAFNSTTLLIYVALAVALFANPRPAQGSTMLKKAILALIGVTLVSLVWSWITVFEYSFVPNLARAKRWFDFMILYFIFRRIANDPERVQRYTRTLFLGYALVVLHIMKELLLTQHGRLYGATQTNELGAFLAGYWGLCLLMALELPTKKRILASGAIAFLATTALVYTLSRGGYVAFAFVVVVLLFYLNKKLLATLAVSAVCVYSVIGFGLLPDAAEKRVRESFKSDIPGSIQLEASAYSRVLLAQAAWSIAKEYPIAGTGWGCLSIKGEKHLVEVGMNPRKVIHNMYLQILAELGILGFVPFVLILWFSFIHGRRLRRRAAPGYFRYFSVVYLSTLAAFVVSNLFGNRMFSGQTTGYFWIMCALIESSLGFESVAEESSAPVREKAHTVSSLGTGEILS